MTERQTPRIGFFLGSMVGGMRDGKMGWRAIGALAQRAEAVGFDSFWVPDHLLFRFEGEAPHAPWEGWSILSALAATTTRIGIGSLVVSTGFRNPGLLAKMADTVDEISGGRFTLGLGSGWHEPEYRAYGYPLDHKIDRFEEAVMVIHTLLREGHIDHAGRYYTLRDCELRPRGPRPLGPPILIGALTGRPRMLRLATTYADIWNGWLVPTRSYADQGAVLLESIGEACVAVGRDPASIGKTVGLLVDQSPGAGQDKEKLYVSRGALHEDRPHQEPLVGPPERIAEELLRFGALGFDEIQISPSLDGLAAVEAMAPVIELVRAG